MPNSINIFTAWWLCCKLLFFFYTSAAAMHYTEDSLPIQMPVYAFQFSSGYGDIIQHSSAYKLLDNIQNTYYLESSILFHKNGSSAWHKTFGYPALSYSGGYIYFGNAELGSAYYLATGIKFYLLRIHTFSIHIWPSTGISLHSKFYHPIENPVNQVIGSKVNHVDKVSLGFQQSISKSFILQAAGTYMHFSNGSIKKPNRGINLRNIEIALVYISLYSGKPNCVIGYQHKRRIILSTAAAYALTNQYNFPEQTFAIWKTQAQVGFFYWKYGIISTGIVGEQNHYFKKLNETSSSTNNISMRTSSLSVGHELVFGRNGIRIDMYKTLGHHPIQHNWRTRAGLNYYLHSIDLHNTNRPFIGFGVVARKNTALYGEVCAGYVF